ncbi:methyltransferase domain-containing protein [Actinomadura logoneensis]|uniref:Methyltransferase domain-containing protein n=1 Tax=Actinomadura logoneensis TaxID=2293572 RepID=A0A372JG85_9ACTN|nr:methyltransferase domain-containing protein [Actinomadura logoneensis]
MLLRLPGVYRPQGDTFLLEESLRRAAVPPGARVLDVCTGTGAVAMAALRNGAGRVTAVDVSRRAVLATRANAWLRGLPVRVFRGDLLDPVAGERFDVILANPPYVPAPGLPRVARGSARAWDAGPDGRDLLDRICAHAPGHLVPGGMLMLVHSALCGVDRTLASLREGGLKASVVARRRVPFGPVMRARAEALRRQGLLATHDAEEELVVIRADRTRTAD